MCIGVWTLEHPEYALIICTNRDEYLDRPTQPAHYHCFGKETVDQPADILSGIDERGGGTWFGINRTTGRIAMLTNITEQPVNFGTSRGSLVSSFLLSNSSLPLEEETSKIALEDVKFSGFNLVLFSPLVKSDASLTYETALVTNHGAGGVLRSRPLSATEHECGGISNGIDGAGGSDWPKMKRVIQDFDAILKSVSPCHSDNELVDRLMGVLAWQCPGPILDRSHLRNTVHVTPIQITQPDNGVTNFYGTRLSTVLLIRRTGEVHFAERDIWQLAADGKPVLAQPSSARVFHFRLGINPS